MVKIEVKCPYCGTEKFVNPVNETYLKNKKEINVDIVLEEVEMDEMWSFYHDKSHQHILFNFTTVILAFSLNRSSLCNSETNVQIKCIVVESRDLILGILYTS